MCICQNDPWYAVGLSDFIPVAAGIAAYFIQVWIRMILKRREQTALAITYLREIANEVDTGLGRLKYLYEHDGVPYMVDSYRPIMPTQNWNGVREIFPDDVYRRICNVARHTKIVDVGELRIHLKNYFTVVCKFGNDVITGQQGFSREVARCDLDGTKMVKGLLAETKGMMESNLKRHFWPW